MSPPLVTKSLAIELQLRDQLLLPVVNKYQYISHTSTAMLPLPPPPSLFRSRALKILSRYDRLRPLCDAPRGRRPSMSGLQDACTRTYVSLCSILPPPPANLHPRRLFPHFVPHKPGAPSYPKADEDDSSFPIMAEGNSSVGKGPRTPSHKPASLSLFLFLGVERRREESSLVDTNRWNVVRKGTRGPGHGEWRRSRLVY